MADTPHQPQSPTDVAAALAEAWSAWVKASTTAMTNSAAANPLIQQLTTAISGYAGAVSAPVREFSRQQRELADSMEEWAGLQHRLADHVQTWAEQQRQLADTLDTMLAPLSAFKPRPSDTG
jgi:hypothetical protein